MAVKRLSCRLTGREYSLSENGLIPMEPKLKTPKGVENKAGKDGYFPNGNFTFTENFTSPQLDYRWIGLRGPREEFISVLKDGGLQITPFPVNIKEVKPTSTDSNIITSRLLPHSSMFRRQRKIWQASLAYRVKNSIMSLA